MQEAKIAEYRAEAAVCRARAKLDANKSTSQRWFKVAEEWSRMADELERRDNPLHEFQRAAGLTKRNHLNGHFHRLMPPF
jgi:hypothetical protein